VVLTRHVGLGLILVLLGLSASATPGQALAICVQSKGLAIQKDECLRRGAAVMRRLFQESHDSGSIFGFQGPDNAAAILCDEADKGVVFFSTSSTDAGVCQRNIQLLVDGF
jgi:hypothetical protein